MKLYNSYCYATIDEVAQNIASAPLVSGGIIQSATVSGQSISIDYIYQQKNYTALVTPPDCTELGFNSSFTGISTADAVELSGLCVLALALAFGVKILRRAL